MNSTDKKLAVIYERVSTKRQAIENHSLEHQLQLTEEHCRRNNWEVVKVFKDPGASGRSIERPGFQEMMKFCKQNDINHVVVYALDRFARYAPDQGRSIAELQKANTLVRSVSEPNVDETAAGRFAANMIAASNQFFSDSLSERTRDRFRACHHAGRYLRAAPLGYKNLRGTTRDEANIVLDEIQAPLVAQAFQLVSEGVECPAEVLRKLTLLGLRSKRGNQLKLQAFLAMLRNPVYIGQSRSEAYGMAKGLWTPIVSDCTFARVQALLKGKKLASRTYKRDREEFPLKRFLRCARCETGLTGGKSKGKKGKKYPYYWCYKCSGVRTPSSAAIEQQFKDILGRLRPDATLVSKFPKILKAEWDKRNTENKQLLRRLYLQLEERKESQAKLLDKYIKDDQNIVPHFPAMNLRFEEEINAISTQIAQIESGNTTWEELLRFSQALFVDVCTAWERANVEQKQRVQNILFPSGLLYDRENGILNTNKDCLFNEIEPIVSGKVDLASPTGFEPVLSP